MLETEKNNNELKGIGMKGSFETYTIGDLCSSLNGLWKGKKEPFVNVGVIRNANFTKDFKLDYSNIEYIDVELRSFEKRNLQDGDLIIEKSGGSEKNPVGRAVLYEGESGKYSYSNFTSILRIKDKKQLSSKYLYNFILYRYKEGDMADMQSHSTGIHNLDYEKYLAIEIPVPSLTEQERIVEKLDEAFAKIDALKENAQKGLQAMKDLWQATLNSAFSSSVFKKTDDILDVVNGFAFKSEDFKKNAELKVIKITNVGVREFVEDDSRINRIHENLDSAKVYEGDVVIALTRTIISSGLKVAVVPNSYNNALLNQRVACLRENGSSSIKYVYYYLSSKNAMKYVLSKVNTLMQPNLSIMDLRNMPIPYVPKDKQYEIVAKLEKIQESCLYIQYGYEQELSEYEALKQSILRRAFSGEL